MLRWGADGQAALDLVREQAPAIIVSDIEMPTMTGYEFCKAVKAGYGIKENPFCTPVNHSLIPSTLSKALMRERTTM